MYQRYWIFPKKPFMFSGRYWSHIQDLQDFIRRIFVILRCPSFPKVSNHMFWIFEIHKHEFPENVPICFFLFLQYFGILKSINKGSQGSQKTGIMEMLGFGPSHNKTIIYQTRIKQNKSPELLNLFSQYNYHKNDPTNADKSPKLFPMIFLRFSYEQKAVQQQINAANHKEPAELT